MMTEKEKFLSLKSYEEFDRRRQEFHTLKFDKEIIDHISKIFPKPSGITEELYKIPRSEGGNIGNRLERRWLNE